MEEGGRRMMGFILVVSYFGMALIAAAIVLQPDRFVITRSAVIDAPPDIVFRHINELRNWEAWSPWAKLDPHAKTSYAGPPAGAGAIFEWSGDKSVGAGRMTIIDSRPNESINIKLDMQKPFVASNDVSFALTPEDGAAAGGEPWIAQALGVGGAQASGVRTRVIWTMSGPASFLSKAMNLVMNRDRMVGGQFEKGLANLNAAVTA